VSRGERRHERSSEPGISSFDLRPEVEDEEPGL